MKLNLKRSRSFLALALPLLGLVAIAGCSLIPETRHREVLHNPFPQMKRVAVLPFFNQSSEPTVNGEQVAESYYAALQAIPGFEVLPVGVAKMQWLQYAQAYGEPQTGEDFQRLAQSMGVEALVVGSVTDYDAYYPPRLAMTAHWYAANEGFHSIPAGYGLPWGTDAEEQIPRRIVREAEFELARSQLATQTPLTVAPAESVSQNPLRQVQAQRERGASEELPIPDRPEPFIDSEGTLPIGPAADSVARQGQAAPQWDPAASANPAADAMLDVAVPGESIDGLQSFGGDPWAVEAPLPSDWPDPTDLIPDPPAPQRPPAIVNHDPVLSHTRLFRGDDAYFTQRLADYVETGDDARPGGWQGYLKRSDDFIRFCCHLHISEMLEARGGSEQSDLILRWPLSRY